MGYLSNRIERVVKARILKRWGNTSTKKSIWDEEFSSGQWDYLDHTGDDPIYAYLEKYSNNGSILDLGCGSGNTGNEMLVSKYGSYTGVDISESAIEKAFNRSKKNRRQDKNEYVCADISLYAPKKRYNVILFRESIFYIPKFKIKGVLGRYSDYLMENGVFIVRMCDRKKYKSIVRLIEKHYHVVDQSPAGDANIILVFK
jgi:2-polyprenyl-6-hydroxyphenyl methylase/3-demethylubiquinone-9 3-methyltransferase